MSEIVRIDLAERSYDIHVAPGLLARAGKLISQEVTGPVPLVTDENVAGLYLDQLMTTLKGERIDARPIVLPPGEATKSFPGLERLVGAILRTGADRGSVVVALGGGVIGDVAGLAAALVKRGMGYVQIPTTLLAQVDSSVGGKTAINTTEGKNLVGLFHQPKLVVVDTDLLRTLPRRDLLSGYAEVVKYGVMGDATFFDGLEQSGIKALSGEGNGMATAVVHSCRIKAAIVTRDEREFGERALLNLGHTFGHALEAATGFSDRLLHGEAVAIGLALALALSVKLGLCPREDLLRVLRHLRAVGLPGSIDEISGKRPSADEIIRHMKHDKKTRGGRMTFILVRRIGEAFQAYDVEENLVRELLTD
jgi:3-dehydroquinate synthase